MSLSKRGKYWWYEFWFAGRRIQESSKSASKSVAKLAEQKRRRELEEGFNSIEDQREEQVRTIRERAKAYFESYVLRNQSATFAEYALKHINEHLADRMLCDIDDGLVREYQDARLRENAAPKTINEEVGFLLRLLGDRGEAIRSRLKKLKQLKLRGGKGVAKVYSSEEKEKLLHEASEARSPLIYPILMLALETGMRNAEIRHLRWEQVNLKKQFLVVRKSKTEGGEGRTIPLSPDLLKALERHALWYEARFGRIEPALYLFPSGKANHLDPTKPVTTIKTSWRNVRRKAGVKGRLHDSRHTLVTELAESGAGDQTIKDIAGHVSPQMLKHYSHIRMKAKREALEAVWRKQGEEQKERKEESEAQNANQQGSPPESLPSTDKTQSDVGPQQRQTPKIDPKPRAAEQDCSPQRSETQDFEGASLQKSLQSGQVRSKTRKS